MTFPETDPILSVMIAAAHAGGAEIRRFFRQELSIQVKTRASDVVTQADLASEAVIVQTLRGAFPAAGIQSEEAQVEIDPTAHDEWFIVDPLDGTHNFSLGVPLCAISIARMQPFGTLTHGVVYEPIVEATYAAAVGSGAWHLETGRQLHTSRQVDLAAGTTTYACGYGLVKTAAGWKRTHRTVAALRDRAERVMLNWTPATDCALVARGATEGLISDRSELHDVAAGLILVREAGGVILNFAGQPAADADRELIFAANRPIAQALVAIVSRSVDQQ